MLDYHESCKMSFVSHTYFLWNLSDGKEEHGKERIGDKDINLQNTRTSNRIQMSHSEQQDMQTVHAVKALYNQLPVELTQI